MRFVRFIRHACLIRNPIYFPGFAAIVRERLFEVRRTRGQVRPNISNEDDLAINRILGEEFAASVLEFADLGWVEYANFAVRPIKAPLMGLGIVKSQGQTFDMADIRAVEFDGVQLRAAIPKLVADAGTVKFDPGRGTD